VPPEILGPFGALVALGIAVAALWRSHERSDHDVMAQRDRAFAGWEAQTTATNRLADAIETRERDLANRTRRGE
jgi:hypothetical protein